jgi:hypothetical protein
LILLTTVVGLRRWRKRLDVHAWRVFPLVAFITVIVTVATASATTAIAATAPAVLGQAMLFVGLPDYPTIICIVCFPLVEDAIPAMVALVSFGVVVVVMLLLGLCHEDGSLLALRVLGLDLRRRRLKGAVDEWTPFLGLGALVCDLEEPNHIGELIIHGVLFLHLDVGDARKKHGDDFLIGHLAEALDVVSEHLAFVLAHLSVDFVSQKHGVPREETKGFEHRGCTREIYSATKHGDGRL